MSCAATRATMRIPNGKIITNLGCHDFYVHFLQAKFLVNLQCDCVSNQLSQSPFKAFMFIFETPHQIKSELPHEHNTNMPPS